MAKVPEMPARIWLDCHDQSQTWLTDSEHIESEYQIPYIPLSAHQKAVGDVWEKAIKVVRDMLPELEENYEAEKPMGFVGASYELGQAKDIIAALEAARKENQ